ncbi:hypothetical protein TNCV_3615711 [Trichonephila clavipes]|nr:hypothetical protein TNCV_3615711 [Trichonephila clavipes]
MESMRLLITSWDILSHSSRTALISSWSDCGGSWRPATRLPRASQTCSIGFMSRTTRWPFHSYDSFLEGNPPPEVCAPVHGDTTIHQHSPTAKSETFVHERRIILTATVPPDENTVLSGWTEKRDSSEKRTLLHSFLLQFACSIAYSLRSRRCLDVSLTNTIGRRSIRDLYHGASLGQSVLKPWCQ